MTGQDKDWSKALKQSPNDLQLLIEVARHFIAKKQAGEFLSIFEEVYSSQHRKRLPPQIIFSIGQTALQEKRWDLACDLLDILRERDQTSPALIAPLSEALLRAGRLSEATNVLQQALRKQSNNDPTLLTNLAIVQAEQGFYSQAEATYRRVIELRPNDFLGHFNLAGFLTILGRDAEAIRSYEQCLKIVPEAPEAQNALDAIKRKTIEAQNTKSPATEQSVLIAIYQCIEQSNWSGALEYIQRDGEQLDAIRKQAAILELPPRLQDQISQNKLYDPHQQVKQVQLFKADDPILDQLTNVIFADKSLVWDRAGKPTRHGAQSHELLGHRGTHECVDVLVDHLVSLVKTYRRDELESLTGSWHDPIRLSGWAVVLRDGGFQKRHIHPEAKFSGVFYVKIPETTNNSKSNQGDLCLFGGAEISPLIVTPSQGHVVMFPSYIPHETIPLINTQPRICIAFNVQ